MRAHVVGSPIAHSLSPVMHNAAYRHLGLDDWAYSAVEVGAGDLASFVDGLQLDVVGLSVTAPLKAEAAQYATTRCPLTEALGVANTLTRGVSGEWVATNTDVYGIAAAVSEVADPSHWTRCVVLGRGATAQSALAAIVQMCPLADVMVVTRDGEVGDGMSRLARHLDVTVRGHAFGASPTEAADLVISTVPHDVSQRWWGSSRASTGSRPLTVLDAVYGGGPSPLVAMCVRDGGVGLDGTAMLAHQAVPQIRLMTGRNVSVSTLRTSLISP